MRADICRKTSLIVSSTGTSLLMALPPLGHGPCRALLHGSTRLPSSHLAGARSQETTWPSGGVEATTTRRPVRAQPSTDELTLPAFRQILACCKQVNPKEQGVAV